MGYTPKLFAKLILFFMLAQLIGLYVGNQILKDMNANPYVTAFVVTSDTQDPLNAIYFFGYILVGAVFFILIMKFSFANLLFKLIEFILIATSSSIVFYSFLRILFGFDISMEIGILLGLTLAILKIFLPALKNTATIFAAAGAGVIFGVSLGPIPVVLFLVFLSLYDYLAVFKTGHMVRMAEFITKQDLSFTITAKTIVPETKKEARIDLGSGDVIAPIMFGVSLLQISLIASLSASLGAFLFLSAFLLLALKTRIVLPALPPIVAGMFLFFAIGKLIGLY